MSRTEKVTAISRSLRRKMGAEECALPPGWVRLESRSKPGSFFYAHPATNRTQVEHPLAGRSAHQRTSASGRAVLPQLPLAAPSRSTAVDLAAEEEEEAATVAREEAVRQARVAKRALMVSEAAPKSLSGSDEETLSKEELESWKANEECREREEAEAERRRKQQEEDERRRKQEEERRRKDEAEEMAKRLAEYEAAMALERCTQQAKALALKQEEQTRRQEAQARERDEQARKEEDHAREREAKFKERGKPREDVAPEPPPRPVEPVTNHYPTSASKAEISRPQRIAESTDPIPEPCFDVFKSGAFATRHMLGGPQRSWLVGRGPDCVDIAVMNDSVSRKHAEITRQGMLMFMTDLGSAHSTTVDDEKLNKFVPVRLCSGANVRFGCCTRVYVFREPSAGIVFNAAGQPAQSVSTALRKGAATPVVSVAVAKAMLEDPDSMLSTADAPKHNSAASVKSNHHADDLLAQRRISDDKKVVPEETLANKPKTTRSTSGSSSSRTSSSEIVKRKKKQASKRKASSSTSSNSSSSLKRPHVQQMRNQPKEKTSSARDQKPAAACSFF